MWGRGWGGVGHVNVPCTLHTLLMFRNCQDVGQGLGWGGACVAKKFEVEAVCHQRKQFTRKTAQKASTRPCLAGTNDRQGMAFLKVWMAPCSYQCHTEEGRSQCSFSNSFGTRVSMGLATAPRTHVTNSVLHCTATSPETLKKWDETKIRRCSLQEVLMNKRQCELQKVTEMPRPSVRRVPSYSCSVAQCN